MSDTRKAPAVLIPGIREDVKNYLQVLRRLDARAGVAESLADLENIRPEEWDGLLIPGGEDIDPARYGQANTGCRIIDPVMDELQFTALERFLRAGKPVLGICNGMQMINIYFGGDLIQDIPQKERHQHQNGHDSYHGAFAAAGGWVSELYGETLFINSAHHQAVGRIGDGLDVVLRSDDDVIEGIAHRTLPVYGLQWHPERMCPPEGTGTAAADEAVMNAAADGTEFSSKQAVNGMEVYRFFLKKCADHK